MLTFSELAIKVSRSRRNRKLALFTTGTQTNPGETRGSPANVPRGGWKLPAALGHAAGRPSVDREPLVYGDERDVSGLSPRGPFTIKA